MSCTTQYQCSDSVKGELKNLTGLDGCSWVLELEDGVRVEPINLEEFDIEKQDGQKIYVSYEIEQGYASICMIGSIVRITCIEKR